MNFDEEPDSDEEYINDKTSQEEVQAAPVHPPVVQHEGHGSHNLDTCTNAVFSMLIDDPLSKVVEAAIEDSGRDHMEALASDLDGMTKLLDDTLWNQFVAKITNVFEKGAVASGVFMHHGTTMNKQFRGGNIYIWKPARRARQHGARAD